MKHENPVKIFTAGAPPPAAVLFRGESGFHGESWVRFDEDWHTRGFVRLEKKQWNNFPASERARLKARKGVGTIGLVEVDVVNPASGKSVKTELGLVISKNLRALRNA